MASSLFVQTEEFLVEHVGGRLQVFVDSYIPLSLLDEPVAHAEFETQLFHVASEWIEVPEVQHPRRHLDGIALIPVVALAAGLGITVAFECAEIGFGMGVAAK